MSYEWTEEERIRVVREVEDRGVSRRRSQGRDNFNEADFLSGAMQVMYSLGLPMTKMPASWTFGMMAGMSALDRKEK